MYTHTCTNTMFMNLCKLGHQGASPLLEKPRELGTSPAASPADRDAANGPSGRSGGQAWNMANLRVGEYMMISVIS